MLILLQWYILCLFLDLPKQRLFSLCIKISFQYGIVGLSLLVVNLTRCTISEPKSQNAFTNSVKWCIVFIAFGEVVCRAAAVADWFNDVLPPCAAEGCWELRVEWIPWWRSAWADDDFEGDRPTEWDDFCKLFADPTMIDNYYWYYIIPTRNSAIC